ncbi:hypothetical protein Fcan01_14102 [Folsomia candida]|uniref:F-box domain-containing protein n=1 Tax=Folsomia candida TaxID=158441 RepID=A0A226E0Q7_FOLCA|nr:hypothetical protein Fcan01_14102 [Folsomia candida]
MIEGCFDVFDSPPSTTTTKISPTTSSSDCNVTATPSQTTISMLPDEILALIFHKVAVPSRNSIRQTCQLWQNVMDCLVGSMIRIGTFSQFDPLYCSAGIEDPPGDSITIPKYHSPSILAKIGVSQNSPPSPSPLPHFKSPNLVAELHLFGRLSPPHFAHFLHELSPSLRVLSFAFVTLQYVRPSQLQNLALPHLKVLLVRSGLEHRDEQVTLFPGPTSADELIETWDLRCILDNLLVLSHNHFPNLTCARFDLIYGAAEGFAITKAQLSFLQSHADTIETFTLEYSILLNGEDDELGLLHAPEDDPELTEMVVNSLQGRLVGLRRLRILPLTFPSLPFTNVWKRLVQEQVSLADFAVMGVCYDLDFLRELVDTNYTTLTTLCIWEIRLFDDQSNTVVQLDCRVFNKCTNLKKLALRGWTVTLQVVGIVNLDQLPVSLEHVDLRDMAIRTSDVRILSLEMGGLEILELHFVGNKREMGMDVGTLRSIIEERRLREVRIFKSLNGRINPDGIFNGDGVYPEQIVEMPGGFIAFEMGPNGYYVNSSTALLL